MKNNLEELYQEILRSLGENPERDGLQGTPKRAAKAMHYLTSGYSKSLHEIVNGALFPANTDEMIIIKDIELYSMCEHHLLPFIGKCHIGYVPGSKVLGLSKFARIVEMFARRLQIQENMTQQIAEAVMEATNAQGVGVCVDAKHMCMMMRGVEKQNSAMTTSVMLGSFRINPLTRSEFMQYITR